MCQAHVVTVNCTLRWADSAQVTVSKYYEDSALDNNVVGMAKCSSQSKLLGHELGIV